MAERYSDHVDEIEAHVGPFGFRSTMGNLIVPGDAVGAYVKTWESPDGPARLKGRTPASLDRDRILYSGDFRRQDDKFHVLFMGSSRLARNYTTHSLRAAHLARSMATRLGLNSDLAEAIVLGSKVGGVPFLHRSKKVVSDWVIGVVSALDQGQSDRKPKAQNTLLDIGPDGETMIIPSWIDGIESPTLRREIDAQLPWARGSSGFGAYSAGQQSYWGLTTNPFLRQANSTPYMAETMYGIWRHTLVRPNQMPSSFSHQIALENEDAKRDINQGHATHEAILARYCDDITWILENLSEASRVASLEGNVTMHYLIAGQHRGEFSDSVLAALGANDTGKLYSYFVDDLVSTTMAAMPGHDPHSKTSEVEPLVQLSDQGWLTLNLMSQFLTNHLFEKDRIRFRNETLDGIVRIALEVLYRSHAEVVPPLLRRTARLAGWWSSEAEDTAMKLMDDPVHRVQTSIDLLMTMSDKDVYELVGLE